MESAEEKTARILEIEFEAEKRATAMLRSYRERSKFIAAGEGENIDELYRFVLGDDLDELIDLMDDDAERIDLFVQKIMKKKSPKGYA